MQNKVKLVATTTPNSENLLEYFDVGKMSNMSNQDFIAYCARVSNPQNQNNTKTSEKLLKYCMDHKHWSIFEMVNVVMEINTTRDIARQILRHRSFHFQEFSQRYANPMDLGFTTREARLQDKKNRQNSIKTDDETLQDAWTIYQHKVMDTVTGVYHWAINNGIAKEQARAVLPEGMTMSRMYMNGTLRDWYHYCQLRMDEATQLEHREIAKECWGILTKEYPFLVEDNKQE